jgi:uncharacterized membrane protein
MEPHEHKPSTAEATGRIAGRQIGAARLVFGNKPISSAIIVLAAAILITGGGHIRHPDTQLFVMAVGCVVGLLGLLVWFISQGERQ